MNETIAMEEASEITVCIKLTLMNHVWFYNPFFYHNSVTCMPCSNPYFVNRMREWGGIVYGYMLQNRIK